MPTRSHSQTPVTKARRPSVSVKIGGGGSVSAGSVSREGLSADLGSRVLRGAAQ